jgi:hypothetical protein
MYFQVLVNGSVIGTSTLEFRDDGMAVATGRFFPLPDYDAVRATFKKFWDALPENSAHKANEALAAEYYRERDELGLRLRDNRGSYYDTGFIHIVDAHPHEEFELSVHVIDPRFWSDDSPKGPSIKDRVECEMESFRIEGLREWAMTTLVATQKESRIWMHDAGSPLVEVVIVAERADKLIRIGYCDTRPLGPWRVLVHDDPTFGRDDSWFQYLEDAFVSLGWPGKLPTDYTVR